MPQQGFYPSEKFDISAMAQFMRLPEIYAFTNDGLAPAPETVNFEEFLTDPRLLTVGCYFGPHIIGFVQFQGKTSVAAEMTAAFVPRARGKVAHQFCAYAIQQAWQRWLTIFALVPADNLAARLGCNVLGFTKQGQLHAAITRLQSKHRAAGLYDIIIYGLHNPRLKA